MSSPIHGGCSYQTNKVMQIVATKHHEDRRTFIIGAIIGFTVLSSESGSRGAFKALCQALTWMGEGYKAHLPSMSSLAFLPELALLGNERGLFFTNGKANA